MNAKFDFFEVVEIQPYLRTPIELVGKTGAILGRAQNDHGEWSYSIRIFGIENAYSVDEGSLRSTGKHMKREDFYSRETLRVTVDPETGEGKVQ